ncbi:SMI1/KNR4 family protein [Kitasatospora sp. NPDC051853]|uniref:SMI1/KNR4 family protein n=1 Tax=Kitasatospora sp. NPDC051853 TaxID=3364058 RepID=UPI0037952B38
MNGPAVPPPLTEAEAGLGVTFPEEYRRYLLEVSSGGAVARLERTEDGWWWADNEVWRRALLTVPFPHPDSYLEAEEELDRREPTAGAFSTEDAFARAWKAWDAEYEDFQDRKTAGSVVVQEHGCGFATLLAVTGPLAGTVWWDGRATCELIVPLSPDHAGGARPATFGEWLGRGSQDLLPPGWGRRPASPDPATA